MSDPGGAARAVYYEPARGYLTAWALFALLLAGFVVDCVLGAGTRHVVGWLIAIVLVVGVDLLGIHAARTMRSITVTPAEVRVGEQAVSRAAIMGIATDVDPSLPVLGLTLRAGLPRGTPGLAVHLFDGDMLVVPTRHPDRLAAAIDVSLEVPAIRLAEPDDLLLLAEIDDRAESLFRVAGHELPDIPFPGDETAAALAIFVAGRPAVGFVWVDEVDGLAHVAELAVVPGRMREGLGTALLDAACNWATALAYPAITLTTFADVAWNAPFYLARGFVVVDDITPELARLRAQERATGLDAVGTRVVMRRELPLAV